MKIGISLARPRLNGMAAALCGILLATAMVGCSNAPKESSAQAAIDQKTAAAKMVNYGGAKMESFLGYGQTEAVKNMLGGARGIFIAPYVQGGAAFLGTDSGTGYLMRRHGKEWSDPVFMKLTEFSLGYQAGAKEAHMMILLMTDEAVDQFMKGKMEIGGKGGFAVGTLGMGASGAGGIKGGLEELIICTNEGVFLGGGMTTLTPSPATAINEDIYGKSPNLTAILAVPGGKYEPARSVRGRLTQMVVEAWGVRP